MGVHFRVAMPHWVGGHLQSVGCSACGWRYPLHPQELPTRSTAQIIGAAFDAHDCSEHPPHRCAVPLVADAS